VIQLLYLLLVMEPHHLLLQPHNFSNINFPGQVMIE